MADPIRSTARPESRLVPFAWLVLVLSAVANTVVSVAGVGTMVHLGIGAVTALSAAVLITHYLRGRR